MIGITKRKYNKDASKEKAYEIYLRSKRVANYKDRGKEFTDETKWSVGDLRREKCACRKKLAEQLKIILAINNALESRGYPLEVKGGGC